MTADPKAFDVLAPVPALTILEFHANGFGNADNRGMTLSAKACGNIAAELREVRAAVSELIAADKAYDDAKQAKYDAVSVSGSIGLRATAPEFQAARKRRARALSRIGGAK